MPKFARTAPDPTARPHIRIARIGVWATSLALLIAIAALAIFLWGAATDHTALSAELVSGFGIAAYTDRLTGAQLWVGAFFWVWVDALGVLMFWHIRALFSLFRDGAVFTSAAARRLRLIGWIILAMAPAGMIGKMLGGIVLSAWITGKTVHSQIAIEDSDIYAIIIGLVIVAIGHVMKIAADMDAENRAFV